MLCHQLGYSFLILLFFSLETQSLTAAGYLCYLQAIHRLIDESHRLPWREKLLELSPEELVIVVLIVFICIVFLKAYAIGIVWRCYKYLTLRQQSMRTLLPLGIPDLTATNLGAEERAYSTLLPNYDEAVAQFMKQAPPPSYQVAMSNCPTEGAAGNLPTSIPNNAEEDNNNDSSNNNNTVHVNNNTPAMSRNENTNNCNNAEEEGAAGGTTSMAVDNQETLVDPPSYNEVVIEPVLPAPNSPAKAEGVVIGVPHVNSLHPTAAAANVAPASSNEGKA